MGEYINSKQARFDRSFMSCGVQEVHHLPSGPINKLVFAIATSLYHKANPRPAAFMLFSDVVNDPQEMRSRGSALAKYLQETQPKSTLTSSPLAINPRTGNVIQVWIFTPDHDSFRKWYQEELANRIEE